MAYSVRVRRQHPKEQMRRDGMLFTTEPTYLKELTPGLKKEIGWGSKSWFIIEEVSDEVAQEEQRQGDDDRAEKAEALALQYLTVEALEKLKITELRERAQVLSISGNASKKNLVTLVFEAEEAIRTAEPVMDVVDTEKGEANG